MTCSSLFSYAKKGELSVNTAVSKKETLIPYVIAFALILLMVIAAVMLNDHEIILPEVAAMAIAMWVYRDAGWNRQPSKIFIAPFVTAAIGFAVNQLDITYIAKVTLTLALIMLFFAHHSVQLGSIYCNRLIAVGDECKRMVIYNIDFHFYLNLNAWGSYIWIK